MNKLGIYIHIPFCVKKCDYCDFLSEPTGESAMEAYVNALIKELKLCKDQMHEYVVDTVFIGGGTPSILKEQWISKIMNTLKDCCVMVDDAEITIECNPETVSKQQLFAYKKIGINRISFGLQSANDEELKSIGRMHTYSKFVESYRAARAVSFDNINVDIMSALPGQNINSYRETLEKVVNLNPEHISAYSLIVEDGTKMKERVEEASTKGINILPDEEEERRMYYMTKDILESAGYHRYEISNYAKPHRECKHNIGYWRRKDYLGFGIGAASLCKEERYNNTSDRAYYTEYLTKHNDVWPIRESKQKLTSKDQMEEFMFLGLRMTQGISTKQFKQQFGTSYDEIYGDVTNKLLSQNLLIKEGKEGDNIKLTDRGIDISNYVMSEFMF